MINYINNAIQQSDIYGGNVHILKSWYIQLKPSNDSINDKLLFTSTSESYLWPPCQVSSVRFSDWTAIPSLPFPFFLSPLLAEQGWKSAQEKHFYMLQPRDPISSSLRPKPKRACAKDHLQWKNKSCKDFVDFRVGGNDVQLPPALVTDALWSDWESSSYSSPGWTRPIWVHAKCRWTIFVDAVPW